jgi:hypothetical protein
MKLVTGRLPNSVRAQWDKLTKFFLENYFQKAKRKIRTVLTTIETAIEKQDFSPNQSYCLNAILTLGQSIEELKDWRDSDVHSISPKVLGVLETSSSSSSLNDLWHLLLEEHNKVREAFIAAIGVICFGSIVSPNTILVNWPKPTHYPDIKRPEDIELLTKLRQAISILIQLRQLCEQDDRFKSTQILLNSELEVANLARKLYKFQNLSEPSNLQHPHK